MRVEGTAAPGSLETSVRADSVDGGDRESTGDAGAIRATVLSGSMLPVGNMGPQRGEIQALERAFSR